MRIQVVCGAGASSTFVAGRLRRAALAAGLDWEVAAAALDRIDAFADVVLLGPHVADRRDEVARRAPRARVLVLPEDAFTDLDGTRVRALVRSSSAPADTVDGTASKGTP
ncbi:PTS sugar transporter subunit IIB [Microbacterium sp. 22242]|uniref:PTS sugar transporter subunit IIB n=1 Tax=Microbacterium sp. 22242 TaxID=3453896 RepID=UPI003F83281E